MSQIEIITANNADRLEEYVEPMVEAYRAGFASAPWFEVSKCDRDDCRVEFTEHDVDTLCPECTQPMSAAYTREGLEAGWNKLLHDENGSIELSLNDHREFLRATLARPLSKAALFERKYHSVEPMEAWIDQHLPEQLVWIDDTFADQLRSPGGNMRDRGRTLLNLAAHYGDVDGIYTRTKQPAVIISTVRDAGPYTDLYVGTDGVSTDKYPARSISTVPDARTMLGVDAAALRATMR